MTGRFDGRVVFVTGAARGQGRSHVLKFAEEGADVIAVDMCADLQTVPYPLATSDDFEETRRAVEALDRRIVAREADVRDFEALAAVVEEGVAELGRLDVVCANAGVFTLGRGVEMSEQMWQDTVDIDLTGVWHTIKAAAPALIEAKRGGAIVVTSSAGGIKALENTAAYTAAKHGVIGLVKTLALELAEHAIRVNAVLPCGVDTDLIQNAETYKIFRPDLDEPGREDVKEAFSSILALDIPWIESVDVSNAIAFLASDEARYITGASLPVDAGMVIK